MSLHCDTVNGPVAEAARKAIAEVNVHYALPWVPVDAEDEVRRAFEDAMHAREKHPDAQRVADRWFCETVVRLHLRGEGEPYAGLRHAKLRDVLAIRPAEKALEDDDPRGLEDLFAKTMAFAMERNIARVRSTAGHDPRDIAAARAHVQARLAFLRLADDLYAALAKAARPEGEEGMGCLGAARRAEKAAKDMLRQSVAAAARAPRRSASFRPFP